VVIRDEANVWFRLDPELSMDSLVIVVVEDYPSYPGFSMKPAHEVRISTLTSPDNQGAWISFAVETENLVTLIVPVTGYRFLMSRCSRCRLVPGFRPCQLLPYLRLGVSVQVGRELGLCGLFSSFHCRLSVTAVLMGKASCELSA
jgi:hypothetical protein